MSASAIYEGSVWHERHVPRRHAFRQRLFLAYLDLDELPGLFRGRWLWSYARRNLVWFRRADYLGPTEQPLREAVLDRVEADVGRRPEGPVRVLTQLRTFGYLFNPVSFYFCFDTEERLEAIVAEITNTPWRERHAYVLDARQGEAGDHGDDRLEWRFDKAFHVSPFHDMDQSYCWTFSAPGERLEVRMQNVEDGREVFRAGLVCRRHAPSAGRLAWVLVRYPLLTLRVHAAIYWQAARLFLKRTPFFTHPDKRPGLHEPSPS